MGDVANQASVLVRVHSECFTGDVLGSLRCDCGEQLQRAMELIAQEGRGVIVYLRQEGRGIGLEAKLQAYNLQDMGYDTVEANLLLGHQADEREYWGAAGILNDLQVRSIRLLTNNPAKLEHLTELGIKIDDRVMLDPSINKENAFYLDTKIRRMRHMLTLATIEAPPHGAAAAKKPADLLTESASLAKANDRRGQARADQADKTAPSPELNKRIAALRSPTTRIVNARGCPFVTLSYAQSLDGSIAQCRGTPTRISGPEALNVTHTLRAAHDGILIGIGTLLADDPRLTVRISGQSLPRADPTPIILDSRLRTPTTARVFDEHDQVWIVTTVTAATTPRAVDLKARGAKILPIASDAAGRPDPALALAALAQAGLRSIMVEGGAAIISSFLYLDLADQAVITIAPHFLGGLAALQPPPSSPETHRQTPLHCLTDVLVESMGDDLIVWGSLANQSSGAARQSANGALAP